jgi:hypothetical protein
MGRGKEGRKGGRREEGGGVRGRWEGGYGIDTNRFPLRVSAGPAEERHGRHHHLQSSYFIQQFRRRSSIRRETLQCFGNACFPTQIARHIC